MGVFWKNRKRILWRAKMIDNIVVVILMVYLFGQIISVIKGE